MMVKTIFESFDKNLIAELPRVLFEGRIEVVQSESEARRAVRSLQREPLVGIDTETRPTFRKGPMNQVALLQMSTREICFLFRLNMIDLPEVVTQLLADEAVVKVGLSLHDDMMQLRRRRDFEPRAMVDIQPMAHSMGIADQSLQRLYANIFGKRISKGQQLSNWEADTLTEAQKRYAATDAWACIELYYEMMRLQEVGYRLEHNIVIHES